MFVEYKNTKVPIKIWADVIDAGTYDQARNLANHPKIFHHVALMPDTHLGYGMPIGGVIAVENAVIPNAVGVDIGCGMAAVKTNFKRDEVSDMRMIRDILNRVQRRVPVGFNRHKEPMKWPFFNSLEMETFSFLESKIRMIQESLGTLGGGNHFIELQYDVDTDDVWMMIHSGSRNLGKIICDHFNKIAMSLCDMWSTQLPSKDLAFLPDCTNAFHEYWECMEFALLFAEENRRRMMHVFKESICEVLGNKHFPQEINIHHNFACWEQHFGKFVVVHRKGATEAYKGKLGIIPGSMGTHSYIVEGLGNKESFMSCSHGAGRSMSRTDASKTISKEDANIAMKGIVYPRWNKITRGKLKGQRDLGEAPQAYKDIDTVIENQRDLVTPLIKLMPLGVIKG